MIVNIQFGTRLCLFYIKSKKPKQYKAITQYTLNNNKSPLKDARGWRDFGDSHAYSRKYSCFINEAFASKI